MTLVGCTSEISAPGSYFGGFLPGGQINAVTTTVIDEKFETVIRQKYDFSCGSAALATLLSYHYRLPQSEQRAFNGMWAEGDRAQIRRLGFSLLDMKRYLATLGLKADGYEVSLEQIANAGVPGIALIAPRGYRHFVVVKGVRNGEILLGDPSLGLQTMEMDEFRDIWNGVYFILTSRNDIARRNFNGDVQWAEFARAPVGSPFVDPLSLQALQLTAPFYRDF